MGNEFYGSTKEAESFVNQLLSLPATGAEQDWEFEFADPSRIREMIDALMIGDLDIEQMSALALLLISSIQESEGIDYTALARAAQAVASNSDVLDRMYFYWVTLGRAGDKELMKRLMPSKF